MSVLAIRIGAGVLALLALLTLRGKRWAYFAFVVLGLAYFGARAQFQVHVPKYDLLINPKLVLVALQSYAHIGLCAGFYWMSWVQFRRTDARLLWALVATLLVGVLVEVADGMTGRSPSRLRDLVPVAAGALGAAVLLAIWSRLTRKPGYVRVVRPRSATSASKPAAPPRTVPRVVMPPAPPLPYLPPADPATRYVPEPPDFSPTPSEATPAPTPEPTVGAAPKQKRDLRKEIVQRLLAIWQRVLAMLPRLGGAIRARRRAIVIGVGVLVLVGAGGFVLLQYLPAPPPPPVAEQPQAPPPPPPRPLQSEAVGYYEPNYQFTVADRRFIRLTLRPEAFITFARYAGRQEVGCADARIGRDALYLRCEVERVGVVTIDGRFTSRFATSRLDAGVLSAVVTVTSPRGEVIYRARDSFRWHEPE